MKRKKSTSIQDIELQISSLTTRRDELETRKSAQKTELQNARAAKRRALIENSHADVKDFNESNFESEISSLSDAIDHLNGELTSLNNQLAEEIEKAQRETSAAKLNEIAAVVDNAGDRLDKAMAEVAQVVRGIREAIPEGLRCYEQESYTRPRFRKLFEKTATVDEMISAVLAEAVFGVMPEAFDATYYEETESVVLYRYSRLSSPIPSDRSRKSDPAVAPSLTVKQLITDRLRDRAELIMDGEQPANFLDGRVQTMEPLKPVKPSIPQVHVFGLKPFSFVKNGKGQIELVGAGWSHLVPEPVAAAAKAAGFALRMDEQEGADAFADAKARRDAVPGQSRYTALRPDECIPVGDPCGYLQEDAEAA